MRAHERNDESFRGLNSAAIEDARLVLKALFTIDGGSAIALLAFADANAGGSSWQAMTMADLVEPTRFFACGVSLAVVTSALACCIGYAYASAASARAHQWAHPHVLETKASTRWLRVGAALHVATLLTAFASLGAFVWGVERVVAAAS